MTAKRNWPCPVLFQQKEFLFVLACLWGGGGVEWRAGQLLGGRVAGGGGSDSVCSMHAFFLMCDADVV